MAGPRQLPALDLVVHLKPEAGQRGLSGLADGAAAAALGCRAERPKGSRRGEPPPVLVSLLDFYKSGSRRSCPAPAGSRPPAPSMPGSPFSSTASARRPDAGGLAAAPLPTLPSGGVDLP